MADGDRIPSVDESPARRRRSFVAVSQETPVEAVPSLPPILEEEDIPLLTEVVFDETLPPDPEPVISEQRIAELAAEMARAVNSQLACELPTLIEAMLIDASREMRVNISASIEAALREFVAQRGQMPLPLPLEASGEARAGSAPGRQAS